MLYSETESNTSCTFLQVQKSTIACTFKHNVEAMFPLVSTAAEQFTEGVLEHVFSAHVDSEVLAPHALVQPLQLLAEVTPLHIEVEDARVVHQHGERPVCEGRR